MAIQVQYEENDYKILNSLWTGEEGSDVHQRQGTYVS